MKAASNFLLVFISPNGVFRFGFLVAVVKGKYHSLGCLNQVDVALILGANDVVNPAARHNQSSPIYGMPILEVEDAANIIVMKRSMKSGYAGIENELFFKPKTSMLFGDAKKVIEDITKSFDA